MKTIQDKIIRKLVPDLIKCKNCGSWINKNEIKNVIWKYSDKPICSNCLKKIFTVFNEESCAIY